MSKNEVSSIFKIKKPYSSGEHNMNLHNRGSRKSCKKIFCFYGKAGKEQRFKFSYYFPPPLQYSWDYILRTVHMMDSFLSHFVSKTDGNRCLYSY
jgi:hypothetical protein